MFDATIDQIADYATRLRFDMLPPAAVHEAKRRLIDTLGCALGAADAEPSRIARSIAGRARIEAGATVLASGERVLPELAAFSNGVMARYLDGNDTFPGGGGHPSDVIAAALAVAQTANADGRKLIAAIVLAYEIYHALFRAACMRDHGMDHVLYTAIASATAAGFLLGLPHRRLAHAVALAVTPNLALHATRRGDLSMWKGCAAGNAARNGVFAALMAAEGMTGPSQAIQGSHGLAELVGSFSFGQFAPVDGPYSVERSNLKFFLSEYHSQSPITAALQLSREVSAGEIETITIHTYWFAWNEIGSEPEKWRPTTRESADHSLPFIIASVFIHKAFDDQMFSDERLKDPSVHALIDKITIEEDPAFTALFPSAMPCRLEARMSRGENRSVRVDYPRGHVRNPMTDEEVGAKFGRLAAKAIPASQAKAALARLWTIDQEQSLDSVVAQLCRH